METSLSCCSSTNFTHYTCILVFDSSSSLVSVIFLLLIQRLVLESMSLSMFLCGACTCCSVQLTPLPEDILSPLKGRNGRNTSTVYISHYDCVMFIMLMSIIRLFL